MSTSAESQRHLGCLMTLAIVFGPGPVAAQGAWEFHPSVSTAQVYESNLFSTSSNRQEDFITRVTPGVETRYHAPLWTFSGRYGLDAERFTHHPELTSSARQNGALAVDYRPTARLTIAGGAEYLTTRTPAELNVATGLSFTRARAHRSAARSSIARQLNPVTSATLEYAFTRDRLGRGYESGTHAATAMVARRASSRTTLTSRYHVHRFAFVRDGAVPTLITSHSLAVGLRRAMNQYIALSVEAGPRLIGDGVRPELSGLIEWTRQPLLLSLGYSRTQNTVIGLVAPVETQSLRASVAGRFWRSLEVRIAPGAFRSAIDGHHADAYVLGIAIAERFSRAFALELLYDGALQRGGLLSTTVEEIIPRHSVVLRFLARRPDRQAARW